MKTADLHNNDIWFVDDQADSQDDAKLESAMRLLRQVRPRAAQRQIIMLIEELASTSKRLDTLARRFGSADPAIPAGPASAKSD